MSTLRAYTLSNKANTVREIDRINGPYYQDKHTGYTLFPFTYANGLLDIDVRNTEFSEYTGQPLLNIEIGINNLQLHRLLGQEEIVTDIGLAFIAYVRRWLMIDSNIPIRLVNSCKIINVQSLDKSAIYSGKIYRITSFMPRNEYETGNNTWIFKTPLTLVIELPNPSFVTFGTG